MSGASKFAIRPSILVSLKTELDGNNHYAHKTVEGAHLEADGSRKRVWQTTNIVDDPEELEAGRAARSAAWSAISKVCRSTAFGLMADADQLEAVEAGALEAFAIADKFNASARLSRLRVSVQYGVVTQDNVIAVESMRREVERLIEAMQAGIAAQQPDKVRDAANRLTAAKGFLGDDAMAKAEEAIGIARGSANSLAATLRKLAKTGQEAAVEIDQAALDALQSARAAFLDLDTDDSVAAPVVTPDRVLDLD